MSLTFRQASQAAAHPTTSNGAAARVFSTSLEEWFRGTVSEAMPDGCWVSFEANGLPHRKYLRYESRHLSLDPDSSSSLAPSGTEHSGASARPRLRGDGLEHPPDHAIPGLDTSQEVAEKVERTRRAMEWLSETGRLVEPQQDGELTKEQSILPEIDPAAYFRVPGRKAPPCKSWPGGSLSASEIPFARDRGNIGYDALISIAAIVDGLARKGWVSEDLGDPVTLDWDSLHRGFCTNPDGSRRHGLFVAHDAYAAIRRRSPCVPGEDKYGRHAMFRLHFGELQAMTCWSDILMEPYHMLVLCAPGMFSTPHAVYGVGTCGNNLIVMTSAWSSGCGGQSHKPSLDYLHEIDETFLHSGEVQVFRVDFQLLEMLGAWTPPRQSRG
eukprot:CAMPEP_0203874668 /NCGR_PEP_ID=MMETSP0359-20131031/20399_1 /ASSEMBLY_ACC=CAM_ASM_000338 /TAXON_ID=268821 /ORGANISM="Scrippsiella Hangoei, Strain SHTV-5" /LENGTH=382 /DNA_ID=CAMNT_0050793427 /DNA_START=112 /DNA_END=1257 /DNA_ORIENTATION=+